MPESEGEVRLNRFLAENGGVSRREADDIIFAGRVTVNGTVAETPAVRIDATRDSVKVSGKRIWPQRKEYVLLNKPEGVISSADDPQHRRTVVDLLHGVRAHVYPVGRLDVNTSGVMLLTNDGDLALKLTHPRFGFSKTYQAKVQGQPSPRALQKLATGVHIPTESGRMEVSLPAKVKIVKTFERNALLEITVQEGRYHLVRSMCAAVGHPVIKLSRVKFGFLTAAGLPLGRWRYLTTDEVQRLKGEKAS
ncbi:MAG: rRNA pseudouridine synthase [Candidatus Firestonebacteria bacterium]|nr:rRNA pseudouridine synthase [Candidatus Firestonebacteria bacterium]